MQVILSVFEFIQALGAPVMMPIMIFILALILGSKPGRAFRAAVTIGIAFIGSHIHQYGRGCRIRDVCWGNHDIQYLRWS